MKTRNTIQKNLVIDAVNTLKNHPSAEEVYKEIVEKNPSVSKATVYRNLGLLAEGGAILRIEVPNGPDRFDFYTEMHYHSKCDTCGKVFDVELPPLNILEAVQAEDFTIKGYDLVFKGTCKSCKEDI